MLLEYGIEKYSINDLAVNEQNTLAKSFYEHMGGGQGIQKNSK